MGLIWQPSFCPGTYLDFSICLDGNCADSLRDAKLTPEQERGIAARGRRLVTQINFGAYPHYSFKTGSPLLERIHFVNSQVSLQASGYSKRGGKVEYNAMNLQTPAQSHVLLVLFDDWAKFCSEQYVINNPPLRYKD
jgi:hypothetical protein